MRALVPFLFSCLAGSLIACGESEVAPTDPSAGGSGGAGQGGDPTTTTTTTGPGGAGEGGAGASGEGGGAPACVGKDGEAGDFDLTVSVGGSDRRFLLHVPASADRSQPAMLVLGFHGFTASPEDFRDTSHFDEVADERGFVTAYLEGTSGSWNGGACCGVAEWTNVDEVAFVNAVIDAIEASYCIDPKRVHASGFSNGGFVTHRLGCELADRIASIGVVAGQESMPTCEPARPIAVLQVHGSADPVVPFGGNPVLGYPPTMDTIDGWASRDACSEETTVTYDADGVTCESRACAEGSAVELCTVDGGAHDWFGGGTEWTEAGPPEGFVATLAIADFLAAHPMP
jgi:polyhydroxybutyrate depolymerase